MRLKEELLDIISMIDQDMENEEAVEDLTNRLKREREKETIKPGKQSIPWLNALNAALSNLDALSNVLLSQTHCNQIHAISVQAGKRLERRRIELKKLVDKFAHVK